uniref:TPR domain protein n=1 Tax=uncultured bacterium contig00061 TaxID=1181544 RepID=A0A806KNU0_9BACT|nr:TPR domain protein [uncultured bacterium contig00061]
MIRYAGNISGAVRGERRELLRLWEAGSFDGVYSQSQAALALRPMDYFLLTMNGFAAYQLGISQINSLNAARYFDDCVWALRKALLLKNAANDGRLYYVLGKAYSYKGDSFADLTVKYLEKARGLDYDTADIPEYLGMAYASIGDYRNSVAAFAEALNPEEALWPSDQNGKDAPDQRPTGPLLLSIAQSYIALGEFELARAYLQRCIDISPDSRAILSARLLLSDVLRNIGDNDGARRQLTDILAEAGENAEAHYQLGELYALQGETTRARAEWRLALRADPAHLKARSRLSM